jgi:hypothetical protein
VVSEDRGGIGVVVMKAISDVHWRRITTVAARLPYRQSRHLNNKLVQKVRTRKRP